MASSGGGAVPAERAAVAVKDLIEVREGAARLKSLLLEQSCPWAELMDGMLNKLSSVLSALDTSAGAAVAGDQSSAARSDGVRQSVTSSSRSSTTKRSFSRRSQRPSSKRVVATLDDSHIWRKYGQKEIQNSPHPRDNSPHPPGGFLSFFNNQSQNFHLVDGPSHCAPFKAPRPMDIGGSSPPLVTTPTSQPDQVPIDVDSGDEVGRTEKRILWTQEEDVRLMSSWLENSTDSTTGADRGGNQYWSDVVDSYNKTTPSHRKRNAKQCKDRWHKINRWTDLFECAYVKARRVFSSGYSDQMWIDAAHKFYLVDNKEAKLGPFVLIEVWKMCRDVAKWKTYNEELKNARKRKAYHHEGQEEENDKSLEEMPKRPIGQKAAKKAALAAKGKSKALDDGGKSKESAIDVEKLDKFSKIQEEANANRIKVLELQQKLYSDKLETTRLAHLTAQENKESKKLEMEGKKFEKESKMMEAYNNLVSQDTSSMTDEEKAERVAAMKCFRKTFFPEII